MNSKAYSGRQDLSVSNAFNLNTNNPFIIFVPPLASGGTCTCVSTSVMPFAAPMATPFASQSIAAVTVYLSAIQPLLNDDTQTITTTASTIVQEADAIIVSSLNSISMTAYTECTIISPLVSLSQDLQVGSLIRAQTIQCTDLQVDQLSLPNATLSTFSDPATSSILIQINGSWWKIPIVPA
jgi:hypothetical protein